MGTFAVRATIWSLTNPAERAEVELPVDTGATYTVISASMLNRLGVRRSGPSS